MFFVNSIFRRVNSVFRRVNSVFRRWIVTKLPESFSKFLDSPDTFFKSYWSNSDWKIHLGPSNQEPYTVSRYFFLWLVPCSSWIINVLLFLFIHYLSYYKFLKCVKISVIIMNWHIVQEEYGFRNKFWNSLNMWF